MRQEIISYKEAHEYPVIKRALNEEHTISSK